MSKSDFRLVDPSFRVDVRLRQIRGRWIASADTSDGPSVGVAWFPEDAVRAALQPFHGTLDVPSLPGNAWPTIRGRLDHAAPDEHHSPHPVEGRSRQLDAVSPPVGRHGRLAAGRSLISLWRRRAASLF